MSEPLLSLENVTTYYGQMRILEGISAHVREGELVCLLGGNASGKSTTLKTILGIVRPRSGRVLLGGEDVTSWAVPDRITRGIAIVPENRRLFCQGAFCCDNVRQFASAFFKLPSTSLCQRSQAFLLCCKISRSCSTWKYWTSIGASLLIDAA